MPDQNQHHGRRPPFHRGRRGPDRRGNERRTPANTAEPPSRDNVDVEQIMRDIRARISQRHGIDLSSQQIQELAARRLEAILDPRTVKPSLLEQLRRSAAEPPAVASVERQSPFEFEDTTLYESNRPVVRFFRRLFAPLLKLLFNPATLVHALNAQARFNKELCAREAEADRRQVEWNALHYELLQRLVTEGARASLETQSLALRVEALAAKIDFNERRVRGMENTAHLKGPTRPPEGPAPASPQEPGLATAEVPAPAPASEATPEGPRRKRRRRRGRRSGGGAPDQSMMATSGSAAQTDSDETGGADTDDDSDLPEGDGDGDDSATNAVSAAPTATSGEAPIDAHAQDLTPVQPAQAPEPTPAPIDVAQPVEPTPPRDEPVPQAPVNHAEPGPPDR